MNSSLLIDYTEAFYQGLKVKADHPGPIQLQIAISEPCLLSWLNGQTTFPRWYWTNRELDQDQEQIAACGFVQHWNSLKDLMHDLKTFDSEMRAYGGWAFHTQAHYASPWENWSPEYFFLPRWELRQKQGQTILCLNLVDDIQNRESSLQEALSLLQEPCTLNQDIPILGQDYLHTPHLEAWHQILDQAKTRFDQGQLKKLVLSRSSQLHCPRLGLELMLELRKRHRPVYQFWFQTEANQVLWGASPERLYARLGERIYSEAIAGTRVNTVNQTTRKNLEQELLNSPKDRAEHQRVVDFLNTQLNHVSQNVQQTPLKVISAGPVQHLYCGLQAQLNPKVTDLDLVRLLHPTPAVNGSPSRLATENIAQLEPHERGWYSGGLGWISKHAAEWSVTLRTALWKDQQLTFYTGAGIMPDSDSLSEWYELDAKLVSLTSLFQD